MRFYGRNPRVALRLHIWLQILTLLLSTVIIILGFFAVGPERRFTNPHHGIGLAIYILIWVQVMGGALVHRSEKRKRSLYIPLKAMIHHWLGRAIALLGIVQIALGLTLYGSPAFLFVLYTLAAFGLFLAYFILEWLAERRRGRRVDDGGSYYSDEVVEGRLERRHGGIGKLAAAGAAGVGLAALWNRRKRKDSRVDVVGTESGTGTGTSYISNDKYSYDSKAERHGWGRRILEIGAVGGALVAVKKLFGRRNDSSSDVGPYQPPLGGNQIVDSDAMSRIEEGRPPPVGQPMPPAAGSPGYIRPTHPLANPPMTPGRRESGSSYDYDSYLSGSPSRQDRGHGFRNALAAGGAAFAVRSLFKNRKQKKEEERVERERTERLEAERLARMASVGRYTGDGVTPPRPIRNRMGSQSDSDFSESIVDDRNRRPGMNPDIPIAGVGAAAGAALADRDQIRPPGTDPPINTSQGRLNTASTQNMVYPGPPTDIPIDVPPLPPSHRIDEHSSGSEIYTTASGQNRHRHRNEVAAGLAGAALGAAATEATRRRRSSNRNTDSAGSQYQSPPVSLHIKAHNDGRHVTLRRLTEEEAAAEAARQQAGAGAGAVGAARLAGPSSRRRRNSSFSSASDGEMLSTNRRYRRMEEMEAAQQQASASGYPPPPLPGTTQIPLPNPPPSIPAAPSAVTSPGTETTDATEYANNRRRRRAERAQARLAREGRGGGNTVEFS